MKNYHAWTRSAKTVTWIYSEIMAQNIREARALFLAQGREIEKGTLKLAKK